MDFSGTEIQAKATYCATGEEFKTVCDFLSAQQNFYWCVFVSNNVLLLQQLLGVAQWVGGAEEAES